MVDKILEPTVLGSPASGVRRVTETIKREIAKSAQDVNYQEILRVGVKHDDLWQNHSKIRISIRSNAYRDQCHARVSLWTGEEWKRIDHIDPGAMTTRDGMYVSWDDLSAYDDDAKAGFFKIDRAELLRVALEVI